MAAQLAGCFASRFLIPPSPPPPTCRFPHLPGFPAFIRDHLKDLLIFAAGANSCSLACFKVHKEGRLSLASRTKLILHQPRVVDSSKPIPIPFQPSPSHLPLHSAPDFCSRGTPAVPSHIHESSQQAESSQREQDESSAAGTPFSAAPEQPSLAQARAYRARFLPLSEGQRQNIGESDSVFVRVILWSCCFRRPLGWLWTHTLPPPISASHSPLASRPSELRAHCKGRRQRRPPTDGSDNPQLPGSSRQSPAGHPKQPRLGRIYSLAGRGRTFGRRPGCGACHGPRCGGVTAACRQPAPQESTAAEPESPAVADWVRPSPDLHLRPRQPLNNIAPQPPPSIQMAPSIQTCLIPGPMKHFFL